MIVKVHIPTADVEVIDKAAKSDGRSRSSFIARAAVLTATRQSTERPNLERHLEVALAEVDRLTAALAEAEAIPLRMIRAAKGGASDYLGGYCDSRLDAFRHGMNTIVSVVETAAVDPTDYQTRANVQMGAAIAAKEKP